MLLGTPKETPFMFNIYHSPVQQAARSHPNSLAIQRAINELWHDESGETSSEPLSYADGFRIRPANTEFTGLPPHIGKVISHFFACLANKPRRWRLSLSMG